MEEINDETISDEELEGHIQNIINNSVDKNSIEKKNVISIGEFYLESFADSCKDLLELVLYCLKNEDIMNYLKVHEIKKLKGYFG